MDYLHRITEVRLGLLLIFLALAQTMTGSENPPAYDLVYLKADTLPCLNIARSGHTTFCIDGQPMVFGGHTVGFVPTATAEYLRDGVWHTVPLVYPHDHGIAVMLRSGKVFLAGGHKEPLGIGQLFSAELYDPASHTSQGFGCMNQKRAYGNAIEMADGQVVIAGNWFADDGVEVFDDVYDRALTNATELKDVSLPRSTPYILRISDDDAIIFSSLDNHAELIDCGIVDRLNGPAYREPLLDTWRPVRTINVRRAENQFVGSLNTDKQSTHVETRQPVGTHHGASAETPADPSAESYADYAWLILVENDQTGEVSIASITAPTDTTLNPTFVLLPALSNNTLPTNIDGRDIVYSSLLCDRDRGIAYVIGDNDQAQIFVIPIDYDSSEPSPLTIYVTDPQPMLARGATPVLTPEGDLIFAGGDLKNNFAPTNAVIRLPMGHADTIPLSAESGRSLWWLWIAIPLLLACILVVILFLRRKQSSVDGEEAPSLYWEEGHPRPDPSSIDLFERIERLMQDEELYLNPNLRASDVAARVGSNIAYVSAAINSQRSCSFTQYLTAYRIAYAQRLMREDPERKISTISTLSGFSTDSTFFRAFRSITGMSPKEWMASNTDSLPS